MYIPGNLKFIMNDKPILQPGKNCWQIRKADRVAFLVDGADYFRTLQQSLPLAQEQIFILSWDIHSELKLAPDSSETLIKQLDSLVRQKNSLNIKILSWDFSLLVAMSREWLPIYKLDWVTHERLAFKLDNQCPLGGSHHQKIVVIDDRLAFAGGLDLTRGRWDTPEHDARNRDRKAVDGTPLPIQPYHDVQIAVAGEIASALGELARTRWKNACQETLNPPAMSGDSCWPDRLGVDLENVNVAISRTVPAFGDNQEVREVEQLYLDAIASAKKTIYIENQFFTSRPITDALLTRLNETNGPEIILNLPLETAGWLSQQSLDMIRVSMLRPLYAADRNNRLGVYYPYIENEDDMPINLHAKVMIVDDRFVRVGSSNINNRSMGLDTECDLSIEAERNDEITMQGIVKFRNRLLAEHLDCAESTIEQTVNQQSSVLGAIEKLRNDSRRSLRLLEPHLPEPDEGLLRDILVTDPERPLDSDTLLNHFVPDPQARPAGLRLITWISSLAIVLLLALTWQFSPLADWIGLKSLHESLVVWQNSVWLPVLLLVLFIVGGFLGVPVTFMIALSVVLFGPVTGFVYAVIGSLLSAVIGYSLGYVLGKEKVRKLSGQYTIKVSKRLVRRGILTMLVVRVIPVAPFTVINLIAGASLLRFRDFLTGTAMGMIPGIAGVTLITERVTSFIRTPDWYTFLSLFLVVTIVFVLGYLLAHKLMSHVGKKSGS
jgi:phosphatidylserine/phosphatidylglycerophosphate/cardiolipin synthase-like enzyme/uncharacterized membrane protein YdjX (TVP38/TMEM64 family)